MQAKLAMLAGVIVLLLVNWSIAGKERHLREGRIVYLELAPRDPRSLMQGDYMALNYKMANQLQSALPTNKAKGRETEIDAADGRLVARLDEKSVAHFVRIENEKPLAPDEVLLRYRIRGGNVKFASNAFFFQEGKANLYAPARYGEFRVMRDGEILLTDLNDETLRRLGSNPELD